MTLAPPARNTADIAADACHRFATHLELLAHQLGEAALEPGDRERLAAPLEAVEKAVAKVAANVGSMES
ncbi:hypothetical protein ACIBI9_65750 [Nonomuraea sp. NPDC050451]|uniref:hypothetical protein n=1 Tax=Nonomuraea sp. NPDC050451 TaxID=3364364 RepID=UPI0037A6A415